MVNFREGWQGRGNAYGIPGTHAVVPQAGPVPRFGLGVHRWGGQGDRQGRLGTWDRSPRASIGDRGGRGAGAVRGPGGGQVRYHGWNGQGWRGGQAEGGSDEDTVGHTRAAAFDGEKADVTTLVKSSFLTMGWFCWLPGANGMVNAKACCQESEHDQ